MFISFEAAGSIKKREHFELVVKRNLFADILIDLQENLLVL